jgi:hypothetical protein
MATFDYDVVIIGSGFGGSVVHLHRPGVPALGRPAHRDDDHVPMPRLPVRHHHWSRDQRSGDRGT